MQLKKKPIPPFGGMDFYNEVKKSALPGFFKHTGKFIPL